MGDTFRCNALSKWQEFVAIKECLDLLQGSNVNAKDDNNVTPLMLAASFGATDSVQLLIEKGADPTIKNIDGRTALFNAVKHANTMEVLLMVSTYTKFLPCACDSV